MKGYKKILFFILLATLLQFKVHAKFVEIIIKPKDGTGKPIVTALAIVYYEGKKETSFSCDQNGEILVKLDFDKKYTIEKEKKKFEKGLYKVNTFVPKELQKDIYSFKTSIPLIYKKEGYKVVYTEEPVIEIFYIAEKDKFGLKQTLPAYNYVPLEPALAENKPSNTVVNNEKTNTISTPKNSENTNSTPNEVKNTSETPQVVNPVLLGSPNNERQKDIEREQRIIKSRSINTNLDRELEAEEEKEVANYTTLALRRRSFLEEVADSRRFLKQAEIEETSKRTP